MLGRGAQNSWTSWNPLQQRILNTANLTAPRATTKGLAACTSRVARSRANMTQYALALADPILGGECYISLRNAAYADFVRH
jgi:hypothetical protein